MIQYTFVVCSYNGEARIGNCLNPISKQSPASRCALVVVDNASSDQTSNCARSTWKRLGTPFPITVIHEARKGLSFAREAGALSAANEVIVFVDDDNLIDGNWIESLDEIFLNPSIGAVGAIGVPAFESAPPSWFTHYEHAYACGAPGNTGFVSQKSKQCLYGAGLAIRKDVFLKSLILNPKLAIGRLTSKLSSGDDTELCRMVQLLGWQLYQGQHQFKHFIPRQRTSKKYLSELFYGFGEIRPLLLYYEMFLLKKSPSWFAKQIVLEFLKGTFKSFSFNSLTRKIRFQHTKGLIVGLFTHFLPKTNLLVTFKNTFISSQKKFPPSQPIVRTKSPKEKTLETKAA